LVSFIIFIDQQANLSNPFSVKKESYLSMPELNQPGEDRPGSSESNMTHPLLSQIEQGGVGCGFHSQTKQL